MEVSEVMTKEVVTVGPHYNVADVASLMDAKGIGSVIVLEEERVLGILTERDILKVIGAGEDPKNVAAHEALIGDLYTITPDASVEDAAGQMTQARVRHLPVIEDDKIVGILSIRDVVRWSVREMAQAAELPHMDVSHKVLSIVHPVDAGASPVSFFDNLRIRRTRGPRVASMDREASSEDLDALREFARTRVGVEFFVEPETMVTDTTAVAVAADGEWTRRRVGSPKVIRQVAKQLSLPVYDVQIVG